MTTGPAEHRKELQKVPARQGDLPIPDTENQRHTTIISTSRSEIIRIGTIRINRLHRAVSLTAGGRTQMVIPEKIPAAGSPERENHILQRNRPIMGKTVHKEAPTGSPLVKENHIRPARHQILAMTGRRKGSIVIAMIEIPVVKENPIPSGKPLLMVTIARKEASTGNPAVKKGPIRPGKHQIMAAMNGRKEISAVKHPVTESPIAIAVALARVNAADLKNAAMIRGPRLFANQKIHPTIDQNPNATAKKV